MPSNPPRLIICDISEAPRHRSVPQTISALHPGRPVPPAAEIHPSVMFPAPKRGPYPSISIYKRNTWSPPRAAARAVTYDFGLWRREGRGGEATMLRITETRCGRSAVGELFPPTGLLEKSVGKQAPSVIHPSHASTTGVCHVPFTTLSPSPKPSCWRNRSASSYVPTIATFLSIQPIQVSFHMFHFRSRPDDHWTLFLNINVLPALDTSSKQGVLVIVLAWLIKEFHTTSQLVSVHTPFSAPSTRNPNKIGNG
jgi:hypothetical protein